MQSSTTNNPNKDFEVPGVQPDGISDISFSPTPENFFVASSWNNEVRFWQAMPDGQSVPKAMVSSAEPVLSTSWGHDNTSVLFGGCDKTVQMWNPSTNQKVQVGVHDAPVKEVNFVADMNMVCSGSWDRSIRWWDIRAPSAQPQGAVTLPERVYSMDVVFPLMVVATAGRHMTVFDLRKPQSIYKTMESSLREQTRTVACFPSKTGFAAGSIEGRVCIQVVEEKDRKENFAFRCHRVEDNVYAVNCIRFHKMYGTFATCGSDGVINFWDKEAKQRLKPFNALQQPISAAAFNHSCNIFAYAASYEWSKGASGYNKSIAPQIFLHAVQESEIKPRGKKNGRR